MPAFDLTTALRDANLFATCIVGDRARIARLRDKPFSVHSLTSSVREFIRSQDDPAQRRSDAAIIARYERDERQSLERLEQIVKNIEAAKIKPPAGNFTSGLMSMPTIDWPARVKQDARRLFECLRTPAENGLAELLASVQAFAETSNGQDGLRGRKQLAVLAPNWEADTQRNDQIRQRFFELKKSGLLLTKPGGVYARMHKEFRLSRSQIGRILKPQS